MERYIRAVKPQEVYEKTLKTLIKNWSRGQIRLVEKFTMLPSYNCHKQDMRKWIECRDEGYLPMNEFERFVDNAWGCWIINRRYDGKSCLAWSKELVIYYDNSVIVDGAGHYKFYWKITSMLPENEMDLEV